MVELEGGIRRQTFALPLGIDHVHCYLLPSSGGWTAVDTGLGLPDAGTRWARALDRLDAPVQRIAITHFHPDHVGAAADLAELTGAPVFQGVDDYDQCIRTWGELRVEGGCPTTCGFTARPRRMSSRSRRRAALSCSSCGSCATLSASSPAASWTVGRCSTCPDTPTAISRCCATGSWSQATPCSDRSRRTSGLYPDSRPDPLADYLTSLERIAELAPRIALPGHGEPIEDPAGRARELIAHHRERLDRTAEALDGDPVSAYDVSLTLFPDPLPATLRRFALAETRAHLEYLVRRDGAKRVDGRRARLLPGLENHEARLAGGPRWWREGMERGAVIPRRRGAKSSRS